MDRRIIVCGAGFSGICMAVKLQEGGFTNFQVLEAADSVGGTWRDNHYPGAACDIMSHLYSFSFYPNSEWTQTYSGWKEIRQYMERCVDHYGIGQRMEFGKEVLMATYIGHQADQVARHGGAQWLVQVKGEEAPRACDYFVSCAGPLSRISVPDLKGASSFAGPMFHTGRWDHSVPLEGKRVAIIGTGASAIQVIPEVAKVAKSVTVFQRTAAWVLPKVEKTYSGWYRALLRWVPLLLWWSRFMIYVRQELITLVFTTFPTLVQRLESQSKRFIAKASNGSEEKRRLLTPTYRMGCKRVLLSNTYLKAMCQDHVAIVPTTIDRIDPTGVVTVDGTHHDVDVVVFATGFQVTDVTTMHGVVGKHGEDIRSVWSSHGQSALYGTFAHGFPNFFVLVGPNTGLGTNSIVFMIECQVQLIIRALKAAAAKRAVTIEARADVEVKFNERLQKQLKGTVWLSGCRSWYLDKDGKNTTLWPFSTVRFWWETSTISLEKHLLFGSTTS